MSPKQVDLSALKVELLAAGFDVTTREMVGGGVGCVSVYLRHADLKIWSDGEVTGSIIELHSKDWRALDIIRRHLAVAGIVPELSR